MTASNRTWQTPNRSWFMRQEWHNVLFTHWPVSVNSIRRLIPEMFEVDTWYGNAWITVTPFIVNRMRTRGFPALPGFSSFPQINVRTYVTIGGKPGIYFFSLDATSRAAVFGGRKLFRLPYYFSWGNVQRILDGVDFRSTRDDPRGDLATFRAQYRPNSHIFRAPPGSFDWFLTERYCIYSVDTNDQVWRIELDHIPWPLQTAEIDIRTNTAPSAAGIELPSVVPLTHFCRYLDVHIWRPVRVHQSEYMTAGE